MTGNRDLRAQLLVVFALLFSALPTSAQRGAITLPRNLGELVDQSAVILRGQVMSARVEPAPELNDHPILVVIVRVREVLKGNTGATFTFRQFIWDYRDRLDAAGYRKGQDVLLLLNPPTIYGLVSPAGLEQGRFRIVRDAQGREVAANGQANAGLFRNLREQLQKKGVELSPRLAALVGTSPAGGVPVADLQDLIRAIAGSR
jgi:hypothetical protein